MIRRSPKVPGIHYRITKTWDGRHPAYYAQPVHTASGESIARDATVRYLRKFYSEADAILGEVDWLRPVEELRHDPEAHGVVQEFQRHFA